MTASRLDEIIANKRDELDALRQQLDLADLEARAAERYRPPGRLAAALCRPGINVIAEVKRRSPSEGDLRSSLDPVAQALAYLEGGAAAISVLTDERYFGGTLDDLRAIREAAPSALLLRKDFVLDRLQVAEAAAAGADAVLLIAGVLDRERIDDLVAYAWELGLDALVEAHSEHELDIALASNAMLLGINNRDLATFTTDLATTEHLAVRVPPDRILVAESGIETRHDVARLAAAGVDGYLVGTSLMRAPAPAELLADMRSAGDRSAPIEVSVKLCGLRTEEDALAALSAGADMLGMVFAHGSRREVSPRRAKAMVDIVAGTRVTVGVFDEEDADTIAAVAGGVGVDVVQLSGGDPRRASEIEADVIPRVPLHGIGARPDAEYVLVDTTGSAGGSGRAFLWSFLRERPDQLLVLAGGLTPDNVAAAVRVVRPAVVDVSSGIEGPDGTKDSRLMAEFVRAARGAVSRRDAHGAPSAPQPSAAALPDDAGHFGEFGGMFVPETLMPAVRQLCAAYEEARSDPAFGAELDHLLCTYVGRPTPLYHARNLTAHAGGAQIWLKREDLAHTGAHKINNAVGQALLAKRMGKQRIIAETGAGQHGVATATVCALLGLECIVYMGEEDIERQKPNVFRMRMLGAEVRPVTDGTRTLKDAVNAAIRDWVTNVETTFYLIGSVVGMHPYPMIVRDFQSVIGKEVREQMPQLPDAIVACVGGGSNAIGIFHPFVDDSGVALHGAEAGGHGVETGEHAATLVAGDVGVLHGSRSYMLQDDDGQVIGTHSISAGLDYPGVGPEHAWLKSTGRATYSAVTDGQALDALRLLCRTEGIICALESAHAIALAVDVAAAMPTESDVVVCLSGRGDKDLATIIAHEEERSGG